MKLIVDSHAAANENGSAPNADHISKTASEILRLEKDDRSPSERVSDSITAFSGSMFFVWLHVVVFAASVFAIRTIMT